jgi:hypothetical protein
MATESMKAKWAPRRNTGKTKYNREKAQGESWTDKRAEDRGADYKHTEPWMKQPKAPNKKHGKKSTKTNRRKCKQ